MARDFVSELKDATPPRERGVGFRNFERLKTGDFEASIQASRTHYSTPRATLPSADSYSAFEVALFDKDGKWVLPLSDERFRGKAWAKLFEEGETNSVAGYVPRETVAQILEDLETASCVVLPEVYSKSVPRNG